MRERDYLLCEERGRKKRKKDLETDGLWGCEKMREWERKKEKDEESDFECKIYKWECGNVCFVKKWNDRKGREIEC